MSTDREWDDFSESEKVVAVNAVCGALLKNRDLNGTYRYLLYDLLEMDASAYTLCYSALEVNNIMGEE